MAVCSVQANSKCAMDKLESKLESLVKGLESTGEGNIPEPQNVPGHTAQRVRPPVKILTLMNNVYAIYIRCLERVRSAKCKASNVFLPER